MNQTKHNFGFKHFHFLRQTLFFSVAIFFYPLIATAQNVELLQKNASVAYEVMMQAKKNSDNLAQDAISAENKLVALKDKLAIAEREAISARRKSDEAKIAYDHAQDQWKQATEALSGEWGKTEIK